MPTVSIIMPCYNAGAYIVEAIESVLNQTYQDLELIVIDDGSTDESIRLVQQLCAAHPNQIQLLVQTNKGPYPARNLGLRHAKGELIAFLDADDYWRADALQRMADALSAPGIDLVYCGWQNVGIGASGVEPYVPPAYEMGDIVRQFLRSCPWPIHAALVRRSIIDTIHGFSEDRFSSMDYDLWLRILGQTRRMVRVPEVLAYYRWHGSGQVSAIKWRQVLDALAARQSFVHENPNLVAHLPRESLRDLTYGEVIRQGRGALWRRDLTSAHKLFRHLARAGRFGLGDLPAVMAAMLPLTLFRCLIQGYDRLRK